MGMIINPYRVEVSEKEIYNGIIDYSVPDGYYFESCGAIYGQHIFGRKNLSNYYTIKKKEDETNTNKDS